MYNFSSAMCIIGADCVAPWKEKPWGEEGKVYRNVTAHTKDKASENTYEY